MSNIVWHSSITKTKGQGIDKDSSDIVDEEDQFKFTLSAKCNNITTLEELQKIIAVKISRLGGQSVLSDFADYEEEITA